MRVLLRLVFFLCGTLSVVLGAVGMFVPMLPTTPFLLLAAICYARSSERCYRWLLQNRWCGSYIRNYREGRGVPRKHKIFAIVLLWLAIAYASWFVAPHWWIRLLLASVAAGVTLHIVRMRTYRPDERISEKAGDIPGQLY